MPHTVFSFLGSHYDAPLPRFHVTNLWKDQLCCKFFSSASLLLAKGLMRNFANPQHTSFPAPATRTVSDLFTPYELLGQQHAHRHPQNAPDSNPLQCLIG